MDKQRMRRGAAAVTAVTLLATFGAIAYFADDDQVAGDVTGGTFTIDVNGSGAGDFNFSGTPLYPVQRTSASLKDDLLANRAAAATDTITITKTAPVAAHAVLEGQTATSTAAEADYNDDVHYMVCLPGAARADDCTDPVAFSATVPADLTMMIGAAGTDLDVLVWLVDNGDVQEQGVTSNLSLNFTGITGAAADSLPLTAPPSPETPANFGKPSLELPYNGTGDGFVVVFDTSAYTPQGAGYSIPVGGTVSGQVFETNADGEWVEAANRSIYLDVVDYDETGAPAYPTSAYTSAGDKPQGRTDVHGRFSFTIDQREALGANDLVAIVVALNSGAADGVSHLLIHDELTNRGGINADALELADRLEGRENSFSEAGGGFDVIYPVNSLV